MTSLPESVQIGAAYYTPTGGSIIVDGSAINVVSVTVTTIITIDGSAATVFPPKSLLVPVYNYTALGFGSDPDGSNTDTSSSPTTPTTSTLPGPTLAPSNFIFVDLAEWAELVDGNKEEQLQYWVVFGSTVTQTQTTSILNVCEAKTLAAKSATVTGGKSMGYPPVTMTFDAFGIDKCVYRGASTTAVGSLACPGVSDITCERDPGFGNSLSCELLEPGAVAFPDIWCYW